MTEPPEYNFGFANYRPEWIPYTQVAADRQKLLSHAIGQSIYDIRGVVSQDGWESNWPIVLCFDTLSISFNTKSCYLWAVDLWQNYKLDKHINDDTYLQITESSLIDLLGMQSLRGETIQTIYWLNDIKGFLFQCTNHQLLKIFDAGDELGLEIQSHEQITDLLPQCYLIASRK